MVASIINRITRKGLSTSMNKIGDYSTKTMYASKEQFVKTGSFKAVGKRGFKGERIVKSGEKYKIVKTKPKTMFLQNGYKEFREVQGREGAFVNLEYTGSMLGDLDVGRSGSDVVVGFGNERESKKRKALEKKYGKRIFTASKDDLAKYTEALIKEEKKIVAELLQ